MDRPERLDLAAPRGCLGGKLKHDCYTGIDAAAVAHSPFVSSRRRLFNKKSDFL